MNNGNTEEKDFLIKKGDGTRRLVEGGGEWGGWWRTVSRMEMY